jgi:hypothetical protein
MYPVFWEENESPFEAQFRSVSKILDKPDFTTEEALQALTTLESIREEAAKNGPDRAMLVKLAKRLAKKLELIHKTAEAKRSLSIAFLATNAIVDDTSAETVKERKAIIKELKRLSGAPISDEKDEAPVPEAKPTAERRGG